MESAPVVEQPVVQSEPDSTVPVQSDPFSVDETRFASLSPEQRASLDPILSEWKTRATQEIEKRGKTYEEKYKPDIEKAQALTQLVQRPEFQQWWAGMQRQAMQGQAPQTQQAIAQARPADFATPEEWSNALYAAQSGDPSQFQAIQTRMYTAMATPVVQQLRQGQEELKTTLEMKDLFERHTDAKELDAVGRNTKDPEDKSMSLLEMGLNWASENGKPLEEGYQLARKWADQIKVGAQQQAMGMVQEKKTGITSGPSTSSRSGTAVVEVADADDLMQRSMEYALDHPGQPLPKFVIRSQNREGRDRWSQKT